MSVFKKIKGTFQTAQQDIVDGLRALATLDSQPRLNQLYQLKGIKSEDVNLDAGADLLFNYQSTWQMIQQTTKESATKSQDVSKTLSVKLKAWDKQAEQVEKLKDEVKNLPALLTTLSQLHKLIDGLRQDFAATEKGLDMLENLCEDQQHRTKLAESEKDLALYALQREKEYQNLKVDLAQRHARKMAQLELNKKAKLQERAEAFTSAFQDDLEFYRTHGHPDRLATEFPKVSSLSDIEIDQDKQVLDSFLGPVTEHSAATGHIHDGSAPEDNYFEDDYITGFSSKQDDDDEEDGDDVEVDVVADADYTPSDVDYLTIPTKIDALSVESLDDDSDDEVHASSINTESVPTGDNTQEEDEIHASSLNTEFVPTGDSTQEEDVSARDDSSTINTENSDKLT